MAKRSARIQKPLTGQVAVVAGATRGAGRGIARALGEAGAIVYCTGRSVKGNPSPYKRPETIDETAEMIIAAGGTAIPVRVDHTVEIRGRGALRASRSRARPPRHRREQRGRRGSAGGSVWMVLGCRSDEHDQGARELVGVAHHHRQARGKAHDACPSRPHRRGHRRRLARRRRESSQTGRQAGAQRQRPGHGH